MPCGSRYAMSSYSGIPLTIPRMQIGYYHLCSLDRTLLSGTDFQGLDPVFEGAWMRVVRAVETAQLHGIGVLIGQRFSPLHLVS